MALNVKGLFPLALLAGALYWAGTHLANASDKLSYKVGSASIDKNASSLSAIVANVKIEITNPVAQGYTLESYQSILSYYGSPIAQVDYAQQINIPAKAVTTLSIPVIISPIQLAKSTAAALIDLIRRKVNPVIDFKSTLNFSGGSLTVSEKKTLTIV